MPRPRTKACLSKLAFTLIEKTIKKQRQPFAPTVGPDQTEYMGPRGISHPRNGRTAGPPTNRLLLAVREDGGVVWSSDGAPFAHPVSLILSYHPVSCLL